MFLFSPVHCRICTLLTGIFVVPYQLPFRKYRFYCHCACPKCCNIRGPGFRCFSEGLFRSKWKSHQSYLGYQTLSEVFKTPYLSFSNVHQRFIRGIYTKPRNRAQSWSSGQFFGTILKSYFFLTQKCMFSWRHNSDHTTPRAKILADLERRRLDLSYDI